ncbi:MAG: histidine kinase dimerization/phospho-acceptor domain-containing protein, partial [Pseudomonadota bacterium]
MFINKSSLAKDFKIFSIIILLSVLIISVCVGLLVHRSYYNKQELEIIERADMLDRALSEDFNLVANYANFLGKKITLQNDNLESIKNILANDAYYDPNHESIWTKFGWIKPNNKMLTVNSNKIEEIDVSVRTFLSKTPFFLGKLQFSSPTIGILSKQWILPVGVGIANKEEKFLGTINTGFNLEKLTNKLELIFTNKDLIFMLISEDMKFILASDNVGFSYFNNLPPENFIHRLKDSIDYTNKVSGALHTPIDLNHLHFSYFKHSEHYPFYFIVGEDIRKANEEYWQITFPRIAELSLMGLLFIILLFYFRQLIVKPIILLSNSARSIAQGDPNPTIYYGQYQEVNLLADQLKEIQDTKVELIKAKDTVDLANKNLEHKVKERTSELEKALAIKDEFLNSISHEVRTPVQGITSISQGLIEGWDNHTEKQKFALATAVANNSQRLFSLVSNLLDLTIFNDNK